MSAWDYLLDDDTVTKAWCGACSWHAEGKGISRGREIMDDAREHSELHPGVAIELDDAETLVTGSGWAT